MNRKQERQLEKMLKAKGISKQAFIAEQLARRIKDGIEQQKIRHPNVLRPIDPVSGRPAARSYGPFGAHFSKRYGFLWRRRRMWLEEPVVTQLLSGTRHAHLTNDATTMWASVEVVGW